MVTGASDISAAGPVYGRATNSDKALVTAQAHTTSQPWVEAHGTQVYGPGSSTAIEHLEGHRWRPRPWPSVWPLVTTPAMAISIDSGCSKKKKKTQTWSLVMVGCYHGPTWHCRLPRSYVVVVGAASKMPVCPQVTIIYPGCGRVSDTDKVLGHSLRLDNTVAPDGCMGLCVCVAPVAA